MARRAAVMLLAIVAAGGSIAATPPEAVVVTIRTYNYAALPGHVLAAARVTAAAIFKRAAISVEWIDCRVPQGDGASCTEPLRPGREFMLRLTDVPGEARYGRRALALGTSLLDHDQRSGALMTVDLNPIRAIAQQASADVPTLLGRAIAHEIGHLLLGTSDHPREGLMRAQWLQDEIRGRKPADWGFSRHEALQMRDGLETRTRVGN
jgi:hypothetical protein